MNPVLVSYAALGIAIVFEVTATSLLNTTQQFTRPLPTGLMVTCYLISFYFLSVAIKVLPVGIAYAIWSGLGIVLIALIGFFAFGQRLDVPAMIGMGLILSGVLVINLFSSTVGH